MQIEGNKLLEELMFATMMRRNEDDVARES
jgi:hypothetical protein